MRSGTDALAADAPPGPDAFEVGYDALFAQHWLALVRLARLLVDDTTSAEDVVQDAFLGLYRQRAALVDPGKSLAYLRAAVVNRSRSVIRRRVVARRHLRVAEPDLGPAADAPLLLAEEHRGVLAAVETLPRRQREVLVLRFWENLPDAEIAALLDIAEVTVRATASRGVAAVAKLLAAADTAPPLDPRTTRRTGGGSDA